MRCRAAGKAGQGRWAKERVVSIQGWTRGAGQSFSCQMSVVSSYLQVGEQVGVSI